jgi:hypothetical protein
MGAFPDDQATAEKLAATRTPPGRETENRGDDPSDAYPPCRKSER